MPFFIFNRRNKSSSETLKNGDVIKVDRKFYYHYGVYVNKGKGKVIVTVGEGGALTIRRTSPDGNAWAQLDARLAEHSFTLTHS